MPAQTVCAMWREGEGGRVPLAQAPLPAFAHLCQAYRVDDWFFSKRNVHDLLIFLFLSHFCSRFSMSIFGFNSWQGADACANALTLQKSLFSVMALLP